MAARGESFGESPRACPFVALEGDRDGRSEAPDPRHRCYAVPTPEPRALAHQEAFCVSPNFPGCPIFQDWAARAAARPVSAVAATSAATEQLGVFDAPVSASPVVDDLLPVDPVGVGAEPVAVEPEAAEPAAVTPAGARFDDDVEVQPQLSFAQVEVPPADEAAPDEDDGIPDVPPFLAGRTSTDAAAVSPSEMPTAPATEPRRVAVTEPVNRQVEIPPPAPRSSTPRPVPSEKVTREDVVPSWGIDDRYGAQPDPDPPEDRYGGWLTAVAVVAILALGVAGVIFLPGILAGGPERSPTPAPSSFPSLAPTGTAAIATPTDAQPTLTTTPAPTGPTAEPTVDATPRLYRIRAGDSLARIARRFDLTVSDILAANPDIANPNQIQVGQLIVIPQPPPTAAP